MGETIVVEGSTNREVFEAYNIEGALAPTLEAGQVVVMDNPSLPINQPRWESWSKARVAS
jgi:hypothetical protein